MKLLSDIVNVIALVMVLLLGAVPAHAAGMDHYGVVVESGDLHQTTDALADHEHVLGDASAHCGAPILGFECHRVSGPTAVGSVSYFEADRASAFSFALKNLRPPRT